MAADLVDFPKNKCNFLHKNKLDTIQRYNLSHTVGSLIASGSDKSEWQDSGSLVNNVHIFI